MKNKRKWGWWGVTGGICVVIMAVAGVIIFGILNAEFRPALSLAGFTEEQQGRIEEALNRILVFNLTDEEMERAYKGAVMREGSYMEDWVAGFFQAVFIVDLPEVKQSYGVTYYYVTEFQESYFKYTTLANCLPEDGLIYGDFDCRGDIMTVFIDDWHEVAIKLAVEFGIPWEVAMAQGIHESASGTSRISIEKNNFHGIGAFDRDPYEMAYTFSTPEAGWRGYFENITRTPAYCLSGVFVGEAIVNPQKALRAIAAGGYASDENYIELVAEKIRIVEARAAKKGWPSSAELAVEFPEMRANAARFACQ